MLAYRIELAPDDNATLLVTCSALPEVTTFGSDEAEARHHAVDAIETALAGRIADNATIPPSEHETHADDPDLVRVPALTGLKVTLHIALRDAKMTRAELSRRLGWHREQVDRLFRIDHASRLDQLEQAFAALGRQLDFDVRDAA